MIGPKERERIAKIICDAKTHLLSIEALRGDPVDETALLELKDNKPGSERAQSQHVILPAGFRVAYSVEAQQAGLCSHLSVTVIGKSVRGAMPSAAALKVICQEFGAPYPPHRIWSEEFDHGESTVHLVSIYAPATTGTA
jgi:hypothetical protein